MDAGTRENNNDTLPKPFQKKKKERRRMKENSTVRD
jgi:hypothetical protein